MQEQTVEITCDASRFNSFADLFYKALELFSPPLSTGKPPLEFVDVQIDTNSADTNKVIVHLHPSKSLIAYAAALFARNLYGGVVKKPGHKQAPFNPKP